MKKKEFVAIAFDLKPKSFMIYINSPANSTPLIDLDVYL